MTAQTTRPVAVEELLRAWHAVQDGAFRHPARPQDVAPATPIATVAMPKPAERWTPTSGELVVPEMPDLTDVRAMCDLVAACGANVRREGAAMALSAPQLSPPDTAGLMRFTRASALIMGPMLARLGYARITMPGP